MNERHSFPAEKSQAGIKPLNIERTCERHHNRLDPESFALSLQPSGPEQSYDYSELVLVEGGSQRADHPLRPAWSTAGR